MLFSDFSSSIFNLIVFTAIAALLGIALLRVGGHFSKKALYNVFMGLGAFALLTQLSYVYAPKRIFSNASHHIIEQIGFSFSKSIKLVDGARPESALWDSKQGTLTLEQKTGNTFSLTGREFFEPLFIADTGAVYKLANPVLSEAITQKLSIRLDDTLSLDFMVHKPDHKIDAETYTFSPKINGRIYGPFAINRQNLRTGYSLAGLISESQADFPMLNNFIRLLDQSWIIRTKFDPGQSLDISGIPLIFFPSKELIDSVQMITIDEKVVGKPDLFEFKIPLVNSENGKARFYLGLWSTRSRIYTAHCTDTSSALCELNPVSTDKKQLKKLEKEQESLFITSSSDDVTDNELLSGFYYPLFNKDGNENHFSATIAYNEGSTREQMKFRVISTDKNDLLNVSNRLYNAGDTIRLETSGASQAKNSNNALFRITDLKKANPLQFWHLGAFTLFLIACIYISLYLTPRERITKTEVIAYVLLVVLLTVRSILLWRIATFPPLEDISPRVYSQMVNDPFRYFINGALATLLFFGAVWIWKLWGTSLLAKINSYQNSDFTSGYPLHLLHFAPYALAIALKAFPSLERISAVFAPLMAFFITEFLIMYHAGKEGKSVMHNPRFRTLSMVNWLFCFGYLALSDAGFSIVFTMSSLLYWLIRLLVFPENQYVGEKGSLRHLRFLLPFFLLLVVMFGSPLLLSLLFRNLQEVLYWIAGLLIVLAAFLQIKRVKLWDNKAWVTPLAGSILLIGAAILFFMPGYIVKKVEDKSYIRYRAEVLFRTPDEIIQEEAFRFSLGNDSKLLRAAQNQWIINHYYDKGHFSIYDYFRLLPSFQKGSPYMTQISDLVTVRYLIGEHSQFVILQILFLMIVLIFSALSADTPLNLFSKLRVQLLCILFMVGFFIWMAATNRMVFLGQDFPLLSLNSVLTLIFSFSILFSAIMLGYLANQQIDKPVAFNPFGRKLGYQLVRGLLVIGTLLIFVRKYDINTKKFDLDATAEQLQTSFIEINDLFAEFQQKQLDSLKTGKIPLPTLINGFDHYIRNDKDSLFKNTFSRSAYEAYRTKLSKQNSAENLIHLRRGADGIYAFAINKLYYNVYSPDVYQQAWKGNVFAADNARSFSFLNRDTRASYVMEANKYDDDFGKTLDETRLAKMTENQNLRLSVVPAGWMADSTPAIIISKSSGTMRENRSGFVVKNGVEILRSNDIDKAIVLHPNDVVQFLPEGEKRATSLQYKHKSRAYLAKNVWLNGRRQFYYPLREKFLWSYYFTNLVKNKYDNEAEPGNRNVQSTIDDDITDKVYDLADHYFSSLPKPKGSLAQREKQQDTEKARAFNLVILDDQGSIRALCDYKMGDKLKINPNRMFEFISNQDARSLQSDANLDRLTFGNRCLMRMDNGPASTFKPIMYSAVTSQYNFGWPKLKFGGIQGLEHDADSNKDYVIRRFGGKSGLKFTVPGNNVNMHDMEYYISNSTNTYNSMVVFLGSLDRSEIDNVYRYTNRSTPNVSFLSRTANDVRNTFPVLYYNNENYYIDKFPDWKSGKSIMARGLWENFDLPTRSEHLKGAARQHIQNIAWNLDSKGFDESGSTYKLWSFPEPSHAYMLDRIDLHTAIVQLSTGAAPIYATPLKMAEMAGRLFSFNKGYKASVVAGPANRYDPITADGTWGSQSALASFYSKNLFKAMHETLISGTARNLVGGTLRREFPEYHFYAKTGTISGNRHGGKRDKHLMLIISKNQLHNRELTPEDLKNNKFYVLYFSLYKQSDLGNDWGSGAPELLQNLARTVLQSSSFKAHMQ